MLLRAPQSWSPVVVAAVAMILLALLDLGGAYMAKEAVLRRSPGHALAGIWLFVLLFWVYCSSLQYAELAPVTFGWIVVLQVGVVLLDRFHYDTAVPRGHWVAVAVMVAAQAYLLLVPAGGSGPPAEAAPARTSAVAPVAVPAPRGPVALVVPDAAPDAVKPAARHSRA